jgi:hypothetical protein
VSPDLIRDFDERWWQAAKKVNSSSSSMLGICQCALPHGCAAGRHVGVSCGSSLQLAAGNHAACLQQTSVAVSP